MSNINIGRPCITASLADRSKLAALRVDGRPISAAGWIATGPLRFNFNKSQIEVCSAGMACAAGVSWRLDLMESSHLSRFESIWGLKSSQVKVWASHCQIYQAESLVIQIDYCWKMFGTCAICHRPTYRLATILTNIVYSAVCARSIYAPILFLVTLSSSM